MLDSCLSGITTLLGFINGSVADSFKEKVKAAGGNVDGFMRCSLHWFNYDDLDLHVTEPGGRENPLWKQNWLYWRNS